MTEVIKGYKLFRQRTDGTLGSLFFVRKQIIPLGVWLEAYGFHKKGYAYRPGWHCTKHPVAPHLYSKKEPRVWAEVELKGVTELWRPGAQGGLWYIADHMRVLRVLP